MKEFILIMPEIFLALTLAFMIAGEITYYGEQVRLITATAITGLAGAFIQTIITYQYGAAQVFAHSLSIDGLSLFFKVLFISLAGLAIVGSMHTREIADERRTEYCTLMVASSLAMCLAASAADMLLAFLALQFVNVLAFFLAGYGKRSVLSTEAAVKYMVFAMVSGALLLYGLAILFAHTHTLNIYEIHRALVEHPLAKDTALVVFMLIFLSFCFQFSAFPMYLWAPDVLEGSPTPSSAFLSFGPRAAGFAVAIRFILIVFTQPSQGAAGQFQVLGELDWTRIVGFIAGATMLSGALLAFRQQGAKRLVACLGITESGFLLTGLLVLDEVGIAALLYNLVVDLFTLVGIYYILSFIVNELGSDRMKDMKGLLKRAVPECVCLVLFLLCLIGLPPTPGFIGKFTLIGAAIRHRWLVLSLIAIASMALSTVAVARLAFSMMGDFKNPAAEPILPSAERKAFLAVLLFPVALVGVFAEFVLNWAGKSLGFILW